MNPSSMLAPWVALDRSSQYPSDREVEARLRVEALRRGKRLRLLLRRRP